MMISNNPQLATIFGILGNIVSFMVFLSPIRTFHKIYKKKGTEEFKAVPYSVALFSCSLLLYYGFLKTSGGLMIITINSIGCVIETGYLTMFLIYAPKSTKAQTAKILSGFNLGVFGTICITTFLSFKNPLLRVSVVGWICAIFSVLVFAAPLGAMRRVIRTRSVEYMPFGLSFSLTMCAIMWFLYGLLIKDYYIALPNVLGFTFGITQMVLYLIFRKPSKQIQPDEKKATSAITIIEIANNEDSQKPATSPKSPEHIVNMSQKEEVEEECDNRMNERAIVAEPERMVDIHHPIPVAACV